VKAIGDEASAVEKKWMMTCCFGAADVLRQCSIWGGQGHAHGQHRPEVEGLKASSDASASRVRGKRRAERATLRYCDGEEAG
jgi:hypothetical protein